MKKSPGMHIVVRYWVCLVFLLMLIPDSAGQRADEQVRTILRDAERLLEEPGKLRLAAQKFVLAAELAPENKEANYKAGITLLESSYRERAIKYFQRIYDLEPDYEPLLPFYLGIAYKHDNQFNEAIRYFNEVVRGIEETVLADHKHIVFQHIEECRTAQKMLSIPPAFKVENMGNAVNSVYPDYAPAVDKEGSLLIFTSRRFTGNSGKDLFDDGFPFEEIFQAVRQDTAWQSAVNIGTNINTPFHDSNVALSHDGNSMLVYYGANRGDILISSRTAEGGWSIPKSFKVVNSKYAEKSATMSSDGNFIIFSSDRPGGHGAMDLYSIRKNNNGLWGRPLNLGDVINTAGFEDGPFLAYDNKTLYFSSDGHKGIGGFDIFKSEYDSASGQWTKPESLGFPINSPSDDLYFVMDSLYVYFTSERSDGLGYSDIYKATRLEIDTLDHQQVLEIHARSAIDSVYLDARITLVDRSSLIQYHPEKMSQGRYMFRIPYLVDELTLTLEKEGYMYQINRLTPEEDRIRKTYYLQPLQKDFTGELNNIYFEFDQAALHADSYLEIDKLEKLLISNPGYGIKIIGHTDPEGSEIYNQQLSERRAQAVEQALIDRGIDPGRVISEGKGETNLVRSDASDRIGNRLNRRVEFTLFELQASEN